MYVNPFVLGVLSTIFAELLIAFSFLGYAVFKSKK